MVYVFGDCSLDDKRYELRRAGELVAVGPKVFKVLVYLIRQRDRVVTKEELLERFWPGTFISESALTRCLTMVRKAVQDDGAGQCVVRTIRGHGYRFVAAVETRPSPLLTAGAPPGAAADHTFSGRAPSSASLPQAGPRPLTSTPAAELHQPEVMQGERKHVTVLVAGLKGVTALAQAVEPEVMHDILARIFACLETEVHRVEGCVGQRTADGMMALFGAPTAYEDHAVRALHAALGMQRGLAGHAEALRRTHGTELALRLGLHAGPVVAGPTGSALHTGYVMQSLTARLAYHLQEQAGAGSICVSDAVRQQAAGFFRFDDLGAWALPEVAQPLRVYACTDVSAARSRLAAALGRRVSVFLGRERDMELLNVLWSKVCRGQGQVVCLFGEAGIGKSRLAREFRHTLGEAPVFEAQTLSYGHSMPYHAVIPLLHAALQLSDHAPPHQRRRQLHAQLAALPPPLADHAPLLAHLLGLSAVPHQLSRLSPEEQNHRLRHACHQLMVQQAAAKPLCLLVEDVHWLDSSSQELLDALAASMARLPILLLATARPGFRHTWADYTYFHRLTLDPLTHAHTDALVHDYFRPYGVAADLKALICERTEGNPFFVEEMLRSLQEHGAVALQDDEYVLHAARCCAVPDSVHDVLAARIDRLDIESKAVLQLGAVIGREFPLWLLEAATNHTRPRLRLATLCQLELLHEQGILPEPTYRFKHALTREVAYESLVPQARQALHRRVGQALEEHYAGRTEEVVHLLSHHFSLAEHWAKAVQYGRQAAHQAYGLGQLHDTVTMLTRTQAWLLRLPGDRPRQETLIDVQLDMGWSLLYLGQSDRLIRTCQEAESVAQALDDRVRRAKIAFLHGLSYCFKGAYQQAEPYFLDVLKHLEGTDEDPLTASTTLTLLYNAQGRWTEAAPRLVECLRTYEARQAQTAYPAWGLDYLPCIMCCVILGHIRALQGRTDEARQLAQQASTPALHRAANLVTKAHCAGWYSLLAAALGEDLGALARAEDILCMTADLNAPIFRFGGYTAKSTALLAVEDFAAAREACVQALQAMADTSHRDGLALVYANLARANLALGDRPAAQRAYEAGLPLVALTPARDAPRYDGLQAQLLASGNAPDFPRAAVYFEKSIAADEAAGAVVPAAQTRFALAQMLARQGDSERARALVTVLHRQFECWRIPVWQRKCAQALAALDTAAHGSGASCATGPLPPP